MNQVFRRPLIKPLLAATVTALALAFQPQSAHATDTCYTHCYWHCPEDPWLNCRVGGGQLCGFSAICVSNTTCGALQVQLQCRPVGPPH